jgi:hypothetical protein
MVWPSQLHGGEEYGKNNSDWLQASERPGIAGR